MAKKPTPNGATEAADAAITQGFLLLRVQGGMRNQALGVLVELEKELQALIAHGGGSPANSQKYKDMLNEAQATIAQAYRVIAKSQDKDLEQIAGVSWKAGNGLLNKTVGVDLFSGKIPAKVLEAVTNAPVVMGHPAKDWWAGQSADLRQKFVGQMALGTLLGETNQQLTQRIIGAGIVGKIDPAAPKGIMKKAKADATALVRTSVQSVSNYAKIQSFMDKPDVVKGISWLATLDSRTTTICMGLSKKQWRLPDFVPIGHDKKFPGPTAHWQCRSTQLPVTYSWAELAGKKLPSIDDETLQKRVDEILEKKGFDPARRAAAVVRSQASMDGQVSQDLTYQDWAENKGADFIEATIGPGRAALFNKGLIDFSDLTDQDNRPLTIAELEAAIDTGETPPETLGATFAPAKRMPFVDVNTEKQKAAAAATELAQQEAAKVLAAQRAAAEQAAAEAAAAAKAAADKAAAAAKVAAEKAAAEQAKAAEEAKKAAQEAALKAAQEAAVAEAAKQKKMKAMATKVAATKALTAKELEFYKTLDAADVAAFDDYTLAAEAKAAKKAAKEAAKKPATTAAPDVKAHNLDLYVPNPTSLQFVKDLPGSTAPRLMVDPATGKQWVVKTSSDPVHLKTEATADQVYRLMGVPAPGSAFVVSEGKAYKVAEFIPDAPTLGAWAKGKKPAEVQAMYADARKGFVLDALLGNWDVAGQTNDNMLVKDGSVLRIDNGGSFNYRAQGGLKTADQFGTVVNELKTLREKGTAAGKTSDIFKGATQNEIDTQIAAIVAKRADIVATVQQQLGSAVAGTIDDRIGYLESLLPPGMRKAPEAPAAIGTMVFAPKFEKAAQTRYGASLSLGNSTFEDQQVLVWQELDPAKQALVKAQGTMTLARSAAFQAKMEAAGFSAVPSGQTAHSYQSVVSAKPVHPQDVYYSAMVNAAKTVSAHAVDKKYNASTLKAFDDLVAKAKQELAVLGASIDPGTKAMLTHYLDAAAAIQKAKDAGAVVGTKVVQFPYTPTAAKAAAAPTQNTVINGVTVTRMDVPKIDYTKKEIIGGVLQDTGVQNRGPKMPAAYKLSRGNVEVTVVPYAPDAKTNRSARSYQGVVRVNVKGTDTKAAMNEAAALLHDVGLLDTVQASAAQRELLYLQKGVYLRGDQADKGYVAALAKPDEAAQIEALKLWAEQKYGVKLPRDGTTSRYYNPDGEIPENGVGNRFWRRWDVSEAEAVAAEAGSKFYHASSYLDDLVAEVLKNGSHLTSSWQRLRTGVALSGTGGASSDADLDAGGGDFFYTNHIPKGGSTPKKGIVFKGDSVTRLDLASHTYDSFGAWEANEGTSRRRTLAQITSASGIGISTNTGLFRGGLSLEQVDVVKAGSAAAAKALIDRIKASGISQWPDGRKLEKVIKA